MVAKRRAFGLAFSLFGGGKVFSKGDTLKRGEVYPSKLRQVNFKLGNRCLHLDYMQMMGSVVENKPLISNYLFKDGRHNLPLGV